MWKKDNYSHKKQRMSKTFSKNLLLTVLGNISPQNGGQSNEVVVNYDAFCTRKRTSRWNFIFSHQWVRPYCPGAIILPTIEQKYLLLLIHQISWLNLEFPIVKLNRNIKMAYCFCTNTKNPINVVIFGFWPSSLFFFRKRLKCRGGCETVKRSKGSPPLS